MHQTVLVTGMSVCFTFVFIVIVMICLLGVSTGAARGLGLGLTKKFLELGEDYRVIATFREVSDISSLVELQTLYGCERLLLLLLDVSSLESHNTLKQELLGRGINSIDILVVNAGIMIREDRCALTTTAEQVNEVVQTNTIGAMWTMQTFIDMVINSPTRLIAIISSLQGSITNAERRGNNPSYRLSKAALNSFAAAFSAEPLLREKDCKILCIHPGWVKTNMGTEKAPLTVEKSIQGVSEVIVVASKVQRGEIIIEKDESQERLDSFMNELKQSACVFVKHDGSLLNW